MDREFLFTVLEDFKRNKSVPKLLLGLDAVLTTSAKLDILRPLRQLIPIKHGVRAAFDRAAPYYAMLHPMRSTELQGIPAPSDTTNSIPVRTITMERSALSSFGFSIRGGKELGLDLFVSSVDNESSAHHAGLRVGDQILFINGKNTSGYAHHTAVKLIMNSHTLVLQVQHVGMVPTAAAAKSSCAWVDANGFIVTGPTPPDPDGADVRTVVIRRNGPLGFNVRGGAEYSTGIFISGVDKDSTADEGGLRRGDHILSINDRDIHGMHHHDVAQLIASQPVLVLRVRHAGAIPYYQITELEEQEDTPVQTLEEIEVASTDTLRRSQLKMSGSYRVSPHMGSVDNKALLAAAAQNILSPERLNELLDAVKFYRADKMDLAEFMPILAKVLNGTNKLALFREVRPLIKADDLVEFEKFVITHEKTTRNRRVSRSSVSEMTINADDLARAKWQGMQGVQLGRRLSRLSLSLDDGMSNDADTTDDGDIDLDQEEESQPIADTSFFASTQPLTHTFSDAFFPVTIEKADGKRIGIVLGDDDVGVYITALTSDGIASTITSLVPGLRIITVNGQSLHHCTHAEARDLISYAWRDPNTTTVTLQTVSRNAATDPLLAIAIPGS